ncbi:MAG: hypothetical protein HQM10_22725 [Candidatus Riflebacteria bacterium]|nr:hypothetical protein [Candidatus Riflebacteria bacterium]
MKESSSKLFAIFMAIIAFITLFGEIKPAEAKKRHKKVGIFTRMSRAVKRSVKRTCKKVRRGVVNAGCSIQNGIMDSGVKFKSAITGKKPKRTWVKGHYKKGNKHHTSGHFRRVKRHKGGKKSSGGSDMSSYAPMAPSTPSEPQMGDSLPTVDPMMPSY